MYFCHHIPQKWCIFFIYTFRLINNNENMSYFFFFNLSKTILMTAELADTSGIKHTHTNSLKEDVMCQSAGLSQDNMCWSDGSQNTHQPSSPAAQPTARILPSTTQKRSASSSCLLQLSRASLVSSLGMKAEESVSVRRSKVTQELQCSQLSQSWFHNIDL